MKKVILIISSILAIVTGVFCFWKKDEILHKIGK